jgi:phosphoglycolate phosphatase/pyrophosphatase PpaX
MSDQITKAVLFDLDGTLIFTKRLYLEAYRRALFPYLRRRLSDTDLLSRDTRSERLVLASCVPDSQLSDCIRSFHREYESLHASHFEGVCDGVLELLSKLREQGLKLGIVSGKSRPAWEITARLTALGAFDVVIMDDDMPAPKPDPRGIGMALESLGVEARESVYIGDAVFDLDAAIAAGVRPAAALWSKQGQRRQDLLREAEQRGATILHAPVDLLGIIQIPDSLPNVDDQPGRVA